MGKFKKVSAGLPALEKEGQPLRLTGWFFAGIARTLACMNAQPSKL
jgi:hypothetical protein